MVCSQTSSSNLDESFGSIIDNEVESELAKSDDGDHSFMECEENDGESDGSSSLDLSLKKMSSKMVNQA